MNRAPTPPWPPPRRGWPVFPLRPGQKRPRAELTAWEARATTRPATGSRSWWRRHPDDNVAIATGPAGLVVVDLDLGRTRRAPPARAPRRPRRPRRVRRARRPSTAVPAGRDLDRRDAPAAAGTSTTGRPPAGGPWRNTAGRIGWHIDTRAAGGYVVAAGSIVGGRPYVVIHDRPPAPLPDLDRRAPRPAARATGAGDRSGHPRGGATRAAALAGEVQRVLDAPPGQRNAALNRAAWNLARHIATGHLDRSTVEAALQAAGEAAGGQTPAGVAATIRSAIDARLRRGPRR